MGCCVSLGSQVSISILTDGFIIAMAVVVLGLMMYEYNTLSPIVSGIIVGIMSPAFRGILLFCAAASAIRPTACIGYCA